MPSQGPNFITAIDVGSAKTSVLVAELTENGLRYRGHGISESRGLRKGVITELDKAISSIQKAVEHAEDVAGIPIEHALVGMAGAHIRGMNSHGGLSLGTRAREIARDEIRLAVDKARGGIRTMRTRNRCRRTHWAGTLPGEMLRPAKRPETGLPFREMWFPQPQPETARSFRW